jgi:hypothetical protein
LTIQAKAKAPLAKKLLKATAKPLARKGVKKLRSHNRKARKQPLAKLLPHLAESREQAQKQAAFNRLKNCGHFVGGLKKLRQAL